MDREKFDHITKSLAAGSDRRSVIKGIAAGLFGSVAALGASEADARRRRRRPRPTGCLAAGAGCSTTSGKPCCSGLACTADSAGVLRCTATTPPPPPPPAVCGAPGLGGLCNPKNKTSCGDPETCECILVVDSFVPKLKYHFECALFRACRATYESCTVGAPTESRHDCCLATDYCKSINGSRNGYCKPRPTCPRNAHKCTAEGQPCGTGETAKGCFCRRIPKTEGQFEWICRFEPDTPKSTPTRG
jgi:hypothetical protein